jgi:predicted dehydrogenase
MYKGALVGFGYWGKILFKELSKVNEIEITHIVDTKYIESSEIPATTVICGDLNQLPNSIDFAVVATNLDSHFYIVHELLGRGVHVLCEKPLVRSVTEATELFSLAARNNLVLLTGYTYLHNQVVVEVGKKLANNELGKLKYIKFNRTGFGPIRDDVSANWDLAVHDLAMLVSWIPEGDSIESVQAFASSLTNTGTYDEVYMRMLTKCGIHASITSNWLEPQKNRSFVITGDRKILVYDEVKNQNQVTISNSFFNHVGPIGFLQDTINLEITSTKSPLVNEINYFIKSLEKCQESNINDKISMQVLSLLHAIDKSIEGGCEVEL